MNDRSGAPPSLTEGPTLRVRPAHAATLQPRVYKVRLYIEGPDAIPVTFSYLGESFTCTVTQTPLDLWLEQWESSHVHVKNDGPAAGPDLFVVQIKEQSTTSERGTV